MGCGLLVALIFGGALVWTVFDGGDSADDEGQLSEYMCQQFVKDRLKAPSTADFSDEDHTNSGDHQWIVTGVVDAENSFGAMLRSSYRCELKVDGEDWIPLSVQVS